MGGKTKQTETSSQNTTQTVAPPSWTMPGISDVAGKVTQAAAGLPIPAYQGGFVAQPNADLTAKTSQAYQGAAGMASGFSDAIKAAALGLSTLSPVHASTYTPAAAYDVNPAIQAATQPLWDQLTKQTLPGLRSSALESGAYTGDRAMSVVPGQVIADAAKNAQQIGATIGYQNFNDSEARRLAAYQSDAANALNAQEFNNNFALTTANALPDLFNSAMGLTTSAGDLYAGANTAETQAAQAAIDNALQQHQYAITQPFEGLDIASQLLAQLSGNYGTTMGSSTGTSTRVQSSSGLGNVLQGVLGAASLIGSFPTGGGSTLGGSALSSLFKKGN